MGRIRAAYDALMGEDRASVPGNLYIEQELLNRRGDLLVAAHAAHAAASYVGRVLSVASWNLGGTLAEHWQGSLSKAWTAQMVPGPAADR